MPDAVEEKEFVETFQNEVLRELHGLESSQDREWRDHYESRESGSRAGSDYYPEAQWRPWLDSPNLVGAFVLIIVAIISVVGLLLTADYYLQRLLLGIGSLFVFFFIIWISRSIIHDFREQRQLAMFTVKRQKERAELEEKAKELVKRKDIRHYLCPALRSASSDAFDIAKIIVPILVPLALAGTITIPLSPPLIAMVAVIIARMGTASLCVDYDKKDEDKTKPN